MRTQAVILKKIPLKEYDELVVGYTDTAGKQTYQAKSVLKPTSVQAGHLDLFNLVDFALVAPRSSATGQAGNGHAIITGAHALRAYSQLKSSLPALAAGYFLLEAFDRLVFEGEADPRLFNFLVQRLELLDQLARDGGAHWPTVIQSTRRDLLAMLGYDPADSIEALAGRSFQSLQFARKVIR